MAKTIAIFPEAEKKPLMRTGSNPQKTQKKITMKTNHRVVVVVFIPALTGYYENSLEVFELCLKSLILANRGNYSITLVNNGSCNEVKDFIESYFSEEIDCLIHHRENIGKIDALIGAARGAREVLITLSDADILYKPNWDEATYDVFKAFKKAGSVSPISFRHGLFYGTSSVFKEILLGGIKFSYQPIPENFEDQNKYLGSINWNNEKNDQVKWPIVTKNGVRAIVGSGHQVITVKREVLFSTVPKLPSLTLVGGHSENKYIDEPIDKAGLMRLSTIHNYAYHMGNHVEDWMHKITSGERVNNHSKFVSPSEKKKMKTPGHKVYIFKKHLLKRLFKLRYPG